MRLSWFEVNISGLLSSDAEPALQQYAPKHKDDKLWWEEVELGDVPPRRSWVIHHRRTGARKARRHLRRYHQRQRAWGVLTKRTGYYCQPQSWSLEPKDKDGPSDLKFHILWVVNKLLRA